MQKRMLFKKLAHLLFFALCAFSISCSEMVNDVVNDPLRPPTSTAPYTIEGHVLDRDQGLGNALVTAQGADGEQTVYSDEFGFYCIPHLQPGTYIVTVRKDSFAFTPFCREITVADENIYNQEFVTSTAYQVTGIVTLATGGSAGVKVTLMSKGASHGISVLTDQAGAFTFSAVPAGDYTLSATKAGYNLYPVAESITVANADIGGLRFSSGFTYSLSGRVLDAGLGLANAAVTVQSIDSWKMTYTDAEGTFHFSGLNPGTYRVSVEKYNYSFSPLNRDVTLVAADITDLEFSSCVSYTVSGIVSTTDGTSQVVNVTLSGVGGTLTVESDTMGNFVFPIVPIGDYVLTPEMDGYEFTPLTQTVSVRDSNIDGLFLNARSTFSIGGSVLNADAGLADVTVTLTDAAGSVTAQTDANGYYLFTNRRPGTYRLSAGRESYTFTPINRDVTLVDTDILDLNFNACASYRVTGNITVGDSGGAAAGVTVTLAGIAGVMSVLSDELGAFAFANIPAGNYYVSPHKDGYEFSPQSRTITVAIADVSGLRFTTGHTYSIGGTILDGNIGMAGVPVVLEEGVVRQTTTTDGDGCYLFTSLLPGTYRVTPQLESATVTPLFRDVTVVAGNILDRDFATSPSYRVAGSISVSNGSSAGVTVTLLIGGVPTGLSVLSDSQGNFSFANVPPGSYVLTPQKDGYEFCPTSRSVTVSNANIDALLFTTGTSVWSKNYGSALNESGAAVIETRDGGLVTAGTTNSYGRRKDFYCVKVDGNGTVIWERAFGGAYDDAAVAVKELPDGGLLLLGETVSFGAGGSDFLLIKINYYGDVLWYKTYGSGGCESPHALLVDNDYNAMLVGYTFEEGSSYKNAWIMKVKVTDDVETGKGKKVWDRTYGGTNNDDDLFAITASANGEYVLAGYSIPYYGTSDIWALKIDSANGDVIWNKSFGGNGRDEAAAIIRSGDYYYIAGCTTSITYGESDIYLLKINDSGIMGESCFERHYGTQYRETASSIVPSPDGGFFMVGSQLDYYGDQDGILMKIHDTGELDWQRTYGTDQLNDGFTALCVRRSGLVTAAGYTGAATMETQLWIVNPASDGGF